MTLDGVFRGIGGFMQWTFQLLQNDMPITWVFNTLVVVLGFVGLFYWLNWQKKFNAQAEANPDQRK